MFYKKQSILWKFQLYTNDNFSLILPFACFAKLLSLFEPYFHGYPLSSEFNLWQTRYPNIYNYPCRRSLTNLHTHGHDLYKIVAIIGYIDNPKWQLISAQIVGRSDVEFYVFQCGWVVNIILQITHSDLNQPCRKPSRATFTRLWFNSLIGLNHFLVYNTNFFLGPTIKYLIFKGIKAFLAIKLAVDIAKGWQQFTRPANM